MEIKVTFEKALPNFSGFYFVLSVDGFLYVAEYDKDLQRWYNDGIELDDDTIIAYAPVQECGETYED